MELGIIPARLHHAVAFVWAACVIHCAHSGAWLGSPLTQIWSINEWRGDVFKKLPRILLCDSQVPYLSLRAGF
jgi:hypothetical protein